MADVYPDVVLISSDDDDDDETNFVTAAVNPEIVLISSDDEDDGERNLEEGVASEQEAEYIDLVDHESDHDEEDNDVVEKLNAEEFVDNCDRSGCNNLHALSLPECKKYLREHGMRVSGTKEECIQRIEEYNRLKDGTGESFYPKSSFSINCTGDACRGDVVLFKQNMYNSQRHLIGRRTVAGRIVNETYSASTQHTFLVEVLWSKRCKKLDPLSILPVKGRNLYQFGTFRQPWKSEEERSEVLEEKHQRGKAARLKWKLRETEFVFGDNKGKKLHKVSHRVSSHSKHKHVNKNTTAHSQAVLFQNPDLKRSTELTYHSDPNCSMHSDHHLQEASLPFPNDRTLQFNSLPPCSSSGHSHHNNEQQGPDQGLSQPPDHHHDSESPVHRSKEEKAKFYFPESSFSINCTGDARERDVVLFKQQVFLGGKNVEKRTVAGRIFKLRQCKSRDHRFLIKVLWTVPSMNNHRRFTLLVRSHNLYKFGTYRQPWKDETMRSKMFEEKHRPATHKRKLKKTDIALNKNKGKKRQKVSHNGPSTSKQPTQIAKCKSSKRKDASATRVKGTKTGSKKKTVQLNKKKAKKSKQTIQPHPNPNTNLDPSPSTNLNQNPNSNPIPTTTLNPNPSLILNANQLTNPNAHQNQNPNTRENQNLNSTDPNLNTNSNPISSTTLNPSPSPHLNSNQHTNPNAHQIQKPKTRKTQKPKTRKNQKPKTLQNKNPNNTDPNLNTNLNPVSSTTSNSSPSPHLKPNQQNNQQPSPVYPTHSKATKTRARAHTLKPNQHTNPKSKPNKNPCPNPRQNPNPNPRQNPNPNPHQNPNPANPHPNTRQNPHPNTRQNLHLNTCQNPNPHLNNYMPAHQLQGSSLSLPNEPLVWIPPNQPPFGFTGYGGQWGPNHILTQPPVYDYMAVLMLAALCYQQQ